MCSRSSRSEMFLVKSVLKKCSKVTGEHPCQSVISIKLLFSFIEIALWDWYSSVICCIFSEHLFLKTPLGSCFWCSYLKNRNQLIQTNNNFSSSKKFHARVPQSQIDKPLLFNLFINDLIHFLTEMFLRNYNDDNNPCNVGKDLDLVKGMPHKDFRAVTEQFYDNYMVLNSKKCHYMYLGKNNNIDKKCIIDNSGALLLLVTFK